MNLKTLTKTAVISTSMILAGALPSLAQQGRGGFACPWGNDGMMYGGGGWFGMIFMWLFWGLIIVALVGGVRWLFRADPRGEGQQAPPASGGGDDPLTILKARYAKGEISKEEFEKIKADIS